MRSPEAPRPAPPSADAAPADLTPLEADPPWDAACIADAIQSPEPECTKDTALGAGTEFTVGSSSIRLELYQGAAAARLTTPDARIELYRALPPERYPAGLVLRSERTTARFTRALNADGTAGLTLQSSPAESDFPGAPQDSTAPAEQADGTSFVQSDQSLSPPAEDQSTPDAAAAASIPLEQPAPPRSEQPRLTLLGRVGTVPRFRTSPRGTRIAEFLLAVHENRNQTSWHPIVVFGERAERIENMIAKGQMLEIIGYVHQRERHGRDGSTRRVEEIYATVIRQTHQPDPVQKPEEERAQHPEETSPEAPR